MDQNLQELLEKLRCLSEKTVSAASGAAGYVEQRTEEASISRHLEQEIAHLHKAAQLLEQFEGRHWQQIIPHPEFPAPLKLESNIDYVRNVLCTVQLTFKDKCLTPVQHLPESDPFFAYQDIVHEGTGSVASHQVIERTMAKLGRDYRFQTAEHPVAELRERMHDNTQIGRDPSIPGYTGMCC